MTTELITSFGNEEVQYIEPPIDPTLSGLRDMIARQLGDVESTKPKMAFLTRVAQMIQQGGGRDLGDNALFTHDVQRLDGFDLGFMNPTLFQSLCEEFGLDPERAEAIMMQTEQQTEPHVHLQGHSVFLPLGAEQGYPTSTGGTYLGVYNPDSESFYLDYVEAIPGQPFEVPSGTIHFFSPGEGARFTAIAFVQPRIKRNDGGFDIVNFGSPEINVGQKRASVRPAE